VSERASHDPGGQAINLVVFALIALIGGGNAVGVHIAVDELAPFWAAATRFLAAAVLFGLIMLAFRVPVPRGGALVGSLLYGVLGFFGAFAFLFWGLQETPPGTGQTIIALVPLLTLLLAVAHRLERFTLRAMLGALVAFGGLVFLVADRIGANVPLLSLLAVVAGAAFLAESGVVLKMTPRAHPVASNAVGMLAGGALLLVLSGIVGDRWVAPEQSDTWAAMIFLVVGGSVAVFGLFVFLLGRWAASAVSYVLLLQPLATIAYSAILTGEPITPALFIGAAIILFGVYLGVFARRSTPPAPAA
jgi:drug/metabolite transporter (DMT)-like permease